MASHRGWLGQRSRLVSLGLGMDRRSCGAHSNIRALVSRHFEEGGADFNIVYYKDEPLEFFAATIGSTAELLLQASLETHEAFNSKRVADIKSMLLEFDALRNEQ